VNPSAQIPRSLRERCAAIELLVVDVDGVLTAGDIIYGDTDLECKRFHVRDGHGLKVWHQAGKRVGIVTGRRSPVVERRAAELGIAFVVQGASDKLPAFCGMLTNAGVAADAVCYVGDDVPDLAPMRTCGLAVAVADACAEVRSAAHYFTHSAGGCGAVRETIELILRCQDHWDRLVNPAR
jgi:3-deoxy-D-manno-octulosonate 8-phosphate phosphatase (KDO 8-P phosphatase)